MSINCYYSTVIHGQTVNYYLRGEGPCLLFLHGYMEDHRVWMPVAVKMEGYTVIIPDMPGRGKDIFPEGGNAIQIMANIIHKLVLHLGYSNYSVFGGSMGGYVALQIMRQHANHIKKVVLVSTNPFSDTLQRKERRRKEIAFLKAGKKDLILKFFIRGLADEKLRSFYELMATDVSAESLIVLQKGMLKRVDVRNLIANPPCPLYYIYGDKDNILPIAKVERLLQYSGSVVCKKVTGGTHFLLVEQPEEVIEFILQVLC